MDTKTKAKTNYDVAVMGGGPAGIIAAGHAGEQGLSVVLIEKNAKLAKKLLLTGGGRCNLTNAQFNLRELIKNYNNGEFLFNIFSVFGPKETISFFEKIGTKIKAEKNGRVFPVGDDAQEVLDELKKYLEKNKVEVLYSSEVVDLEVKGKNITGIILKDKNKITAKKYIIATGGRSHPETGSTGIGYKLVEKLGHTIVKPMPGLVPIEITNKWVKGLQGISLKDVKISILQAGRKKLSEEGEIIFTHLGVSGPAILNISSKVAELLEIGEVKISLDLFPLLNQEELLKGLEDDLKKYPNKSIKNILSSFVPEKMAGVLLGVAGFVASKIANNMSKVERVGLVRLLKNIEMTVQDVLGFDLAKITKGGVSLKEINHKTMKSKIIDNLFFAGEIIDIDGKSGGFNLQMCLSTGFIAGENSK